jgi:protein-L-isoaspartate(D-aspartate) O-methyltransferase
MKVVSLIPLSLIHNFMNLFFFAFICCVCLCCTSNRQGSENNKKNASIMTQLTQIDDTRWWKEEADKMVNSQIVARGIKDVKVIATMKNTPRHLFIPADLLKSAYNDGPLPIGEGQTISQPYIVAIMTELLALKGNEKVLEIGTGSGYQAAVLSQLADTIYTIELLKKLTENARVRLKRLGYNNVVVKCDDGYKGWAEHAPFDCIIITAAPEEIPEKLVSQLKMDGRMVLPVGKYFQDLVLITKTPKGFIKENIISVRFVPMVKSE